MEIVLDRIIPNKEEEKIIKEFSVDLIKKINRKVKPAKAIPGGSIAKKTFLKGDYDIDIFIQFPQSFKGKDISKILEKKIKFLKAKKVHGSRDYFQLSLDPFNVELIPIIKINNPAKAFNITDISPLHTKWVKKNTDKKLLNEIRLTKSFCKANNLYGAESYIKGFSGYTLEILTIHYKSFNNLIKNVAKWKMPVKINPEKKKINLNESKLSPLILIDPVQPERNTSASLSEEKFKSFIKLAKQFSRNPNPSFFEIRRTTLDDLKGYLVLQSTPLKGKRDIVGAKLLKSFLFLEKKLREEGYKITKKDWNWNEKALFWFKIKNEKLSPIRKHHGPPIKEEEHADIFRDKYKKYDIKTENNRIYVELKRKHPHVNDFIKNLIKQPYVQERVKKIKLL